MILNKFRFLKSFTVLAVSSLMLMGVIVFSEEVGVKNYNPSISFTKWEETRAIWIDKKDYLKGQDYLKKLLDDLKAANFNVVYVCSQFGGYVAYPNSEYFPQHPEYKAYDALQFMTEEAHKRGLKIGSWTEYGFYTYHTPDATKDKSMGPTLDKHPDWVSIDRNGMKYIHNVQWGDFYALCPVNPGSQDLLINLYCEMIKKYNFDGIDLDRIRFGNVDFCYCPYCKETFKKETGLELDKISKDSEEYKKVTQWRKDKLTDFVRRLSEKLRATKQNIEITSAVASPESIDVYCQDWTKWAEMGYIDALSPMLYGANIEPAVKQCLELVGNEYPMFYGISCDENPPDMVVKQINFLRSIKTKGITFWYAGKVSDDLPVLKAGVFKDTIPPYKFKGIKAKAKPSKELEQKAQEQKGLEPGQIQKSTEPGQKTK